MPRPPASAKRLVAAKRRMLNAAKDQPCADCGRSYPPEAMDFDHIRGTKLRQVSELVNTNHSIHTLIVEMAKCEVVCSNCHRTRTKDRRKGGRTRG